MDKILYTGKDLSEAGAYGFQVQGVTAPARVICCGRAVASAWWPGGGGRHGRHTGSIYKILQAPFAPFLSTPRGIGLVSAAHMQRNYSGGIAVHHRFLEGCSIYL